MWQLIRSLTAKGMPSSKALLPASGETIELPTVATEGAGIHESPEPNHHEEIASKHSRRLLSVSQESESVAYILTEEELPLLGFQPETSAEDYFLDHGGQMVAGEFHPVNDTVPPEDEREWELDAMFTTAETNADLSSIRFKSEDTSELSGSSSIRYGPLPSFAVRGEEAAALKAAIGGDAANLGLEDTLATVTLACRLGMPVVIAGKGLLDENCNLEASKYVVSTLGSRSSAGNFIHALVISPVLSAEEVMSTKTGRIWLESIIRKEQLLVSYRPIRGATSCEDLADRARTMPIDARTIISRQRGLEGSF
ncbi:hypothetical protein [Shinella zoogloeoides]